MAHVVKDRQYSVYTQQCQRWSLKPTLDLNSDRSQYFNHRDNLTAQYSFQTSDSAYVMPGVDKRVLN